MIIYHFRPYDMAYDYSVEVPDGPTIPPFHAFEEPPVMEGYHAVMRNGWELVEGPLPEIPPPPPVDPAAILAAQRAEMAVTPLQAKIALHDAGLLDSVETYINASTTDKIIKLAWENATEWRRLSPMIENISSVLGLSEAQVDELFSAAANVAV